MNRLPVPTPRARHPSRFQAGLTLIELLISVTLGLLLVTAISALFIYTNRSNTQNELIGGMHFQARFALASMSRDIMMAGYWGGMSDGNSIHPNTAIPGQSTDSTSATANPPANDCGVNATTRWAFQISAVDSTGILYPRRIEFKDQTSSGTPSSVWGCINNSYYVSGTDVVATRRVAGQPTGTLTTSNHTGIKLIPYGYYLQSNNVLASFMRCLGGGAYCSLTATDLPSNAPMTFYQYYPRIYYVRNYSRTAGDGIPTLCRKELCPTGYTVGSGGSTDSENATCGAPGATASAGGFYSECLAEGVEDMQIVWGIADQTLPSATTSVQYTSTPTALQVAKNSISAQIFLRMRASRTMGNTYVDAKTYNYANIAQPYTPAGTDANYFRRVYSTTVWLRNPTN